MSRLRIADGIRMSPEEARPPTFLRNSLESLDLQSFLLTRDWTQCGFPRSVEDNSSTFATYNMAAVNVDTRRRSVPMPSSRTARAADSHPDREGSADRRTPVTRPQPANPGFRPIDH